MSNRPKAIQYLSICIILLVLLSFSVSQLITVDAATLRYSEGLPKVSMALLGNLNYDVLFGRPGGYGVCNQGQQSMATPGCDSPLELIKSAMKDVFSWRKSFTLITGGLLRHGTDTITPHEIENMMREVIEAISNGSFRAGFRANETIMYPTQLALGETDFIPAGAFTPDSKQTDYIQLINMMQSYGLLSPDEYSRITSCGYYYRDLSGTKIRVISLNTLLWSAKLTPPLGVGDVDPCGQFPFLQNAIEQAAQRNRNVIILGDIPPVINIAEALRTENVKTAPSYWREDFVVAYFRIIATYRFTVAAQFFGHTNTFGFVASSKLGPPLFIIPSISPVTGSNPSYMRVTLDSNTGRVVALKQRYLDENGKWVEGNSLEDALNIPMRGLVEQLPKDFLYFVENEENWQKLAIMRVGGRFLTEREPCGIWCRRVYACASLFFERDAIDRCAHIDLPSQTTGLILAITFTCVGVFSIFFAIAYIFVYYNDIVGPPIVLKEGKARRRLYSGHTKGVFK